MEVEISQRCVECTLHWAGLRWMRLLYEFDIGDGQNCRGDLIHIRAIHTYVDYSIK